MTLKKYNKFEFYGFENFIEHLAHSADLPLFSKYDVYSYKDIKKISHILLMPFLKNLFEQGHCYRLELARYEDYDDDYDIESLHYSKNYNKNNGLYITIDGDYYEDDYYIDENNEDSYAYLYNLEIVRGISFDNLINALKINKSVQELINLEDISPEILRELNKFCYKEYLDIKAKYNNPYHLEYGISRWRLEKSIASKVFNNYEEYPKLSLLVIYYALIKSNELTDLIGYKIGEMLLSQGFTYLAENEIYIIHKKEEDLLSIKKIAEITNRKKITINNIRKTVLNEIKNDIVDADLSAVSISPISLHNTKELDFCEGIDKKELRYINKNNLYSYKNYKAEDGHIRYASNNERKFTYNDIREVGDSKVNFNGFNYMIFDIKVSPRCYAPAKHYTLQVEYCFKDENRFAFLKDYKDEDISESDLLDLPIAISRINIYNPDIIY